LDGDLNGWLMLDSEIRIMRKGSGLDRGERHLAWLEQMAPTT